MSESAPPAAPAPAPAPGPAPGPAPASVRRPPLLSILAVSFAALALILAFVAAAIAWLPSAAAIVLGIVALVRRSGLRGLAVAALITAPVAWLIAIVVAVSTVATGIGNAIDEVDDPPSSASEADAGSDADADADADGGANEASIGDTVTNDDGVAFTVTAVTCGLATAGENEFLQEQAKGQFCAVAFTLDNGSTEAVNVSAIDVTGTIGSATYEADSAVSMFDGEYFSTDVNPGLAADCVVYIDIPADAALEFVTYSPLFSFGGDVVVAVG